jgi:dUTP pyrophosphatase
MSMKLIVEKVYPNAILPVQKNLNDVGLDVSFHNLKKVYKHIGSNSELAVEDDEKLKKLMNGTVLELQYLERALIGTGIKATVGPGYEIQVRPRSGLALKNGLTVLNTPGTIDPGYRDEIGVIIINLSRKVQTLTFGDRIAQLVVKPVVECEIVEGKLDNIDRGGGFGSTGVK